MNGAGLPLEGVRVLELSTAWAGPYCGRLLADLGAEVIKVESRRRLDSRGDARPAPGAGSYPDGVHGEDPWNRSGQFHERHRNKLGLALELDHPQGREVFLRLVEHAGVLVENFAPRVLRHMRLGYDDLHARNPRLVMVSMSGFGQTGRERDHVAYGPTVEQVSGLASLLGHRDGPPISSGLFFPDVVSGTLAAGAVVAMLRRVEASGEGAYIDMAEIEVVQWLTDHLLFGLQTGSRLAAERLANRHPWLAPQGCFACAEPDSWIALTVETDEQWTALAALVGAPELAERYPYAYQRREHQDELETRIGEWTRTRARDEALRLLAGAGVPAGPVATVDQVLQHEQLQARHVFDEHPVAGTRPRAIAGGVWSFDGRRPGLRRPAPRLGEHNEQVLCGILGMSDAEVADLVDAGVVGTLPKELE